MKIDDSAEIDADCESGQLRIRAWARDRAGNAPFVSFQTDIESGYASFNLEQAKELAEQLTSLVRELQEAETAADGQSADG